MDRSMINKNAFLLRIMVQILVLMTLLFMTEGIFLLVLILALSVVLVVINIVLMTLHDDRLWLRVFLLFTEWLLILTLFPFVPYSPYFILLIVLVVTSISAIDHFMVQIIAVTLFGLTPVVHFTWLNGFSFSQAITFLLLMTFFVAYGIFYRKFDEQQIELKALHQKLKEYAEQEKHWALEKQRNHIAHRLHDTVAHHATGLIVQLQTLKKAYESSNYQIMNKSLNISLEASQAILNDIRQSVRLISPLKTSKKPFEHLFKDFEVLSDIKVHHNGVELIYTLNHDEQAVIYTIFQEALTNAKRHGNAKEISITIKNQSSHLRVIISDDGIGFPHTFEKGFGLQNVYEHIIKTGGTIEFYNNKGGVIDIMWPKKGTFND